METAYSAHSGTINPRPSSRELEHGKLAREIASEGIVLLKNEGGLLPLDPSTPLALLGGGAVKTVKGGTGSGDVNSRDNISVWQGLREAGAVLTSEGWLSEYETAYNAAREGWKAAILADARQVENPFDAYAAHPFALPEGRMPTVGDIQGAKAAVYVISRISGEGRDRRLEPGDYYLSEYERKSLLWLDGQGLPIILLVNAGGPVELTDILEEAPHIQAVLNLSQLGQEGGRAAADVLLGRRAPGGRLTATWAKRYGDYPCGEAFGCLSGDLDVTEYREGVCVGYRYFDAFGVRPLFPFGFGLSYTSFQMKPQSVRAGADGAEVSVLVTNTGERNPGREVVQVYISPPQTGLPKEHHRLAGFAKTEILQPGETQQLTVSIPAKQFASFSEELSAWVVEAGAYGLWVGPHSGRLELAAILSVEDGVILERTEPLSPRMADFPELCGEAEEDGGADWLTLAREDGVPVIPFAPRPEERRVCQPPAADGDVEELIPLLYGNITRGASTLGSAGKRVPGSAGETTEALEMRGIPSLIMADGPAGLRLRQSYEVDRKTDEVHGAGVLSSLENGFLEPPEHHEDADIYYQYCTAFPVGTALAQTWDVDLARRFGEAVAREMAEFHVDLWLAPGMNIQRNPLCGRNFEYFSEDPLLSGSMAAAVTAGVQKNGRQGVTVKHFACNNQEDNRMGLDVRVGERALREIYLRGFEIAVKQAAPAAIMSSYNLLGGVHAANNTALCTTIARQEWGYEGVIMTDWNTTVPKDGSIPWKCAAAGNDIIMPGNPADDESIRGAYRCGDLPEDAIRACALRVISLARKLMGKDITKTQN